MCSAISEMVKLGCDPSDSVGSNHARSVAGSCIAHESPSGSGRPGGRAPNPQSGARSAGVSEFRDVRRVCSAQTQALLIGGWLTQAQKSSRMAAARHCQSCRLQRQGCCCSLVEPERKNRSVAVLCLHESFSEHSCSGLITAISAGGLIIPVWKLIASESHSSRSKFDHGT
jgi:hypothetical protein